MQQQLTRASWLVVEVGSRLLIGRDMHIVEPDLAADNPRVATTQIEPATAHRLDLAASQRKPGLEALFNKVVVACLAILRHSWVLATVVACHANVPACSQHT